MHLAQNDLKAKATQLYQQDIQNRYNQQVQQYQAHANAYQNQQKQIRMQQYNEMANEFKKHPNWADIDTNFYPQWHKALDKNTQASIQHVMQTGNLEGIKKIMNVVVQAYEAKNPAKAAKKVIKSVPSIMSTSASADVSVQRGADASKLATMNPDEQAAWFTKNFI
jgi:transposase